MLPLSIAISTLRRIDKQLAGSIYLFGGLWYYLLDMATISVTGIEMLEAAPITKNHRDIDLIRTLYQASFPKNERVPLWLLLQTAKKHCVDFLGFYDEGLFVGFMYVVTNEDLTLVLYLAVNDRIQSKGYGTRMLDHLEARCPGNRVILDIEEVNEASSNNEQRIKRRAFYARNGFVSAGFKVVERGVVCETLVKNGSCLSSEYEALLKPFKGRILHMLTKPKFKEETEIV